MHIFVGNMNTSNKRNYAMMDTSQVKKENAEYSLP